MSRTRSHSDPRPHFLKILLALVVLGLISSGCARDAGDATSKPTIVAPAAPTATAAGSIAAPTATTAAPGGSIAAPTVAPTASTAPSLAAWVPSGFSISRLDATVAYRWMGKSEFQCDPSPKCWGLRVVAENGCPSDLTITLKLADGTGASLGSVLDTAGVVQVGQEAVMVFEVEAPTAQKAEIESVACT